MRLKQFWAILTVSAMLLGLAGCQGDKAAESVDTEQANEQTTTAAESASENDTEDSPEIERETVLPLDMTMNDLLNMIQINGKTLTMPATLDNIMAIDDGFSYELAYADAYNSLDEYYEDQGHLFYDIYYNGTFVLQACVVEIDNFENISSAMIRSFSSGFGSDLEEAGLDFKLSCGIDLNSNSEDVILLFGEENNDPYGQYKNKLNYAFNDGACNLRIEFAFKSKGSDVDPEDEMRAVYIFVDN